MDNNLVIRPSGTGGVGGGDEDELEVVDSDPSGRFERYQKSLGAGAYKQVFLAVDTEEGVEVAWNELRLNHLQKKDVIKVLSEVQILQQIRHENILSLYHSWVNNSQVYFITELMTSGTLKSYVKKMSSKNSLKPKIVKNWCRQILRGLHYLHTRDPPIIHRDLKCENIFINGNNGQAKIGDLGLAIVKNREYASSVLGTPEFMAPELYDERYDERVDIYSFGLCVLEMCTRDYPYCECTNQAQIFRKVTNGIKPASLEKVVDKEMREFIEWCIEFDFEKRPSALKLLESVFLKEDVSQSSFANSDSLNRSGFGTPTQPLQNTPTQPVVHQPLQQSITQASSATSPSTVASQPSSTGPPQQRQPLTANQPQQLGSFTGPHSSASSTASGPQAASADARLGGVDSSANRFSESGIVSIESLRFSSPVITIRMICLASSDSSAPTSAHTSEKQEVKFPFHLEQDTPESVVDEMIKEGVLTEFDRELGVLWIGKIVQSVMRDNGLLIGADNSTTVTSVESLSYKSQSEGTVTGVPGISPDSSNRTRVETGAASSSSAALEHIRVPSEMSQQRMPVSRSRSRSMNAMDAGLRFRSQSSPSFGSLLSEHPAASSRESTGSGQINQTTKRGVVVEAVSTPSSPVSSRRNAGSRRSRSVSAFNQIVAPPAIDPAISSRARSVNQQSPSRRSASVSANHRVSGGKFPTGQGTYGYPPGVSPHVGVGSVGTTSPGSSTLSGDKLRFQNFQNTSTQSLPSQQSSSISSQPPSQTPQQQAPSNGNPGMSHYHRAIEEKTNEILEGVYRSQYRRGASISAAPSLPAPVPRAADSTAPIVGSGLPVSKPDAPDNANSFRVSPDIGADLTLPQSVVANRPSVVTAPRQFSASDSSTNGGSLPGSRSTSRPSSRTGEASVISDINALKAKQKREAAELAKIHAVEVLRVLQDYEADGVPSSQDVHLYLPANFYSMSRQEQLAYLERELLDSKSPLRQSTTPGYEHAFVPDPVPLHPSKSQPVSPSVSVRYGGFPPISHSETDLASRLRQVDLSEERERRLAILQQSAVADFELGRNVSNEHPFSQQMAAVRRQPKTATQSLGRPAKDSHQIQVRSAEARNVSGAPYRNLTVGGNALPPQSRTLPARQHSRSYSGANSSPMDLLEILNPAQPGTRDANTLKIDTQHISNADSPPTAPPAASSSRNPGTTPSREINESQVDEWRRFSKSLGNTEGRPK